MPTAMHWDHWKATNEPSAKSGNRVPRLEPLFPIGGFSPAAACGHKKRIKRGSSFICMVCHQSGWEGHPDLVVDPTERLTPTRPELATEHSEPVEDRVEAEAEQQWESLTRKQKRAIMFGSKEQSLVRPSDDADATAADSAASADAAIDAIADRVNPDLAARAAAMSGCDVPA